MSQQTTELEVMDAQLQVAAPSALAEITRADIDCQIATAKAYPRSLERFKKGALAIVTLDEETAASCLYSRPVGKKKDASGKWVEEYAKGMSVRMAEIVASQFGNLRVGAMVIEQTPRYVKARGFAHDLETNFASTSEVIESTVTKDGQPFSERMRVVIAKACVAKARRDATFQVVPRALAKFLEKAARDVAVGNASTLGERRSRVVAWLQKLGIPMERVWAALGIAGESEIGLDQLETLTGIKTAIKDGGTTVDEAFPPITTPKFSGDSAPSAPAVNPIAAAAAARQTALAPAPSAPAAPAPAPSAAKPSAKEQDEALKNAPDADWGGEPDPEAAPEEAASPAVLIRRAIEAAGISPDDLATWAFEQRMTPGGYKPLKDMDPETVGKLHERLSEAMAAIAEAKAGKGAK